MRKFIFATLSILFFQWTNAQETVEDNKIILGGAFNFNFNKGGSSYARYLTGSILGNSYYYGSGDSRSTHFTFDPYVGKEIKPGLVFGLRFDYSLGTYLDDDVFFNGQADLVDLKTNTTEIGIGIFTRYILNPKNKFNFFGEPSLAYRLTKESDFQDAVLKQTLKVSYFEASVGLGVLYNFTNRARAIIRVGGLYYINGNANFQGSSKNRNFSSFGTNLNLETILFGLEFKI